MPARSKTRHPLNSSRQAVYSFESVTFWQQALHHLMAWLPETMPHYSGSPETAALNPATTQRWSSCNEVTANKQTNKQTGCHLWSRLGGQQAQADKHVAIKKKKKKEVALTVCCSGNGSPSRFTCTDGHRVLLHHDSFSGRFWPSPCSHPFHFSLQGNASGEKLLFCCFWLHPVLFFQDEVNQIVTSNVRLRQVRLMVEITKNAQTVYII